MAGGVTLFVADCNMLGAGFGRFSCEVRNHLAGSVVAESLFRFFMDLAWFQIVGP